MRFVLGRIFKNFAWLNEWYSKILHKIDGDYFARYCSDYKIISLGTYCLPRVIATFSRLKPNKAHGEKTCPFDLAFFNDFDSNVSLLGSKFADVFEDSYFDTKEGCWRNDKYSIVFNHEENPDVKVFREKYKARINNLYEYLDDESKHIYFLVAIRAGITGDQIGRLISTIEKFRKKDSYSIVIINQSSQRLAFVIDDVYEIDLTQDKSLERINKKGEWVLELRKMKKLNARIFYYKTVSRLRKIIHTKR